MTTNLKIEGMSCGHCVRAAKEALESVEGVQEARVDLDSGSAVVESEESVQIEQLIKAIEEEGYAASRA